MRISIILFLPLIFKTVFAQKPIEPGKMKQLDVTVVHESGTIKTQILNKKKSIKTKPEMTYVWFSQQKLMETKGGFDGKLLHGTYRSFYMNNQLKEQGEMKYGLKNKKWTYWYENGTIRESITWRSGVKNGEYAIYNDLGKIMAKGNFKKDKLDGKFFTYGGDGKVLQVKKYKNGEEVIEVPKPPKTEASTENQQKILDKQKQDEKKEKREKKSKKKNETSEVKEETKSS